MAIRTMTLFLVPHMHWIAQANWRDKHLISTNIERGL